MSECFWVLLPRFSLFFFFFFGKGCIQNEEPNSKREYGCNVFMWFKEKDEKYLAFLTALTFHEDYDLDKKKKKRKEKVTMNYKRELNYKQLWCAPLQRDAAWEITLRLHKPTMKNTNATVERYKANNVITRRSSQGDINSAPWFCQTFSQKP